MDCVNANICATNHCDRCSESIGTIKTFAVGGNVQKNPFRAVGRYGANTNGYATLVSPQPKYARFDINNQWRALRSY